MNEQYHGADSGSSEAILVSHRLDTLEDFRSLQGLIFGWPGLTVVWLDERHAVAVLQPGGALELAQ